MLIPPLLGNVDQFNFATVRLRALHRHQNG